MGAARTMSVVPSVPEGKHLGFRASVVPSVPEGKHPDDLGNALSLRSSPSGTEGATI